MGLVAMQVTGTLKNAAYGHYLHQWFVLFVLLFPISLVLIDLLLVIIRFPKRRGLAVKRTFSAHRIAHFLSGTILSMTMLFFMGTFTSIKISMFTWRGDFLFDRAQADIDRTLHFGYDPWQYVSALVSNDTLHAVTEFSYSVLWVLVCFATLYFVATSARADGVRKRYFIMFMATWFVIGNVIAMAFLSAGPAFYGAVTGDVSRFAGLMSLLANKSSQSISIADVQAYLWSAHLSGSVNIGTGISAFPSVHVAVATMNTLFAFEYNRKIGYIALAYTLFIMAGSVAFGWHYAIDGYVSVAVVVLMHFGLKHNFLNSKVGKISQVGNTGVVVNATA
jgi:hypothetical protein